MTATGRPASTMVIPVAIPLERIDAVVFDTDGVITDTARLHAAAWKRVFDEFLHERATQRRVPFRPFDVRRDYLRYVDGRPRADGVLSFLSARGIHVPAGQPTDGPGLLTAHGIGNRKDRWFVEARRAHGVHAYPSTVHLVRVLHDRGARTAAVSASRHCVQVLHAAGVADLFDVIVDGVEAARLHLAGKPDPALFLEAAVRLGASPDRVAVVEDAQAGVEAARRGRFGRVIGVDRGGNARRLADAGADVIVTDLGEVTVAGHVQHRDGDRAREA
jgi:HAD superfamily hydrolase (TIGR01509 family)